MCIHILLHGGVCLPFESAVWKWLHGMLLRYVTLRVYIAESINGDRCQPVVIVSGYEVDGVRARESICSDMVNRNC